jgi:hypothetical protein
MTRRERLRRCYFHEELDRPGVYCRTGFPQDDPTYDQLKDYLAAHSELKHGWPTGRVQAPYPARTRTKPHSQDYERLFTVLHTPAGYLQSSRLVSLKGQPGMDETHLLKTRQDAEKYLSLPMPELHGEPDDFFAANRQMGERGIVHASLGFNPGGFAAELFGSEAFALMTATDRDVVHALCERQMRIILRRVEYLLARGVGPFWSILGQEYIVPPMHGPADFNDFNVRYDKPILDLIHGAGGRVHVHCHGSIRKVMDGFVEMGADVLHPFEAPPMGDITPAQAKQAARGRICLEGNIQIADMYELTPDEIRSQVEALIATCFDDRRGLIVCPTASPYLRGQGEACLEQFRAMVEAVRTWQA